MFLARPILFSIGVGLLYAATAFPVLAPFPPSLAGQVLAFLVFFSQFRKYSRYNYWYVVPYYAKKLHVDGMSQC
jgi:hypothetical protein